MNQTSSRTTCVDAGESDQPKGRRFQGHKLGAKLRDFVEKKTAPARIEDVQKLARECVRKNYKGC